MDSPLISEYIESIIAAEDNFEQLKHLRPVLDKDGNPVMSSGNFAVVFKMRDEGSGKFHAVKCFLKEQQGRTEAYRLITEELSNVNSNYLTPIKYIDKELFVDSKNTSDTEFPVILMDWVEGTTLDRYIQKYVYRYQRAESLDEIYASEEKITELLISNYELSFLAYFDSAWLGIYMKDLGVCLLKAATFGGTIALISCSCGYFASGGAKGVGLATNKAVVWSFIAIVIIDMIFAMLFFF
jgi:hypothetical protein